MSIWLHEFKTVWLPAEIPNDAVLLHSISNKLGELERLIPGTEEDEDYHRDKLLHDHSSSNSDTEHISVAPTCPTAHQLSLSGGSLPTPPEVQHSFDDEDAEPILDFLDLTSEAAPIPPTSLADPPIDTLSTGEDSLDERYCTFILEIKQMSLFRISPS